MTGHQVVGATYSGKDFSSLDQSLRIIVENGAIEKEDDSWSFLYNFDQYIYEPKKGQGIGIFGRFGASDGDANPIHYFYSIGVGGKGSSPEGLWMNSALVTITLTSATPNSPDFLRTGISSGMNTELKHITT